MNDITIDMILKVSAALTGAILGWMAVFRPMLHHIRSKRDAKKAAIAKVLEEDKAYRDEVLGKLESLKESIDGFEETLALMQRDSIERAYCMFVGEYGYCPSGMKEAVNNTYKAYTAKGNNHIATARIDEILDLPEHPEKISKR